MQPDFTSIFLKSYLCTEERDQSENDSGTSEDIQGSEVNPGTRGNTKGNTRDQGSEVNKEQGTKGNQEPGINKGPGVNLGFHWVNKDQRINKK